jgi:DNA processing protein
MPPIPLNEYDQKLLLNGLEHVGPVTVRRLQEAFAGNLHQALQANLKTLESIKGVSAKAAASIIARDFDWETERQKINQHGFRLATSASEDWPAALSQLWDPPLVLYVEGHKLPDSRAIAIIGSRHCTPYGAQLAKKFAYVLAEQGWWIVSGLARGIDTWAHQGALEAGGKTAAILGHGLDLTYPPEAHQLRAKMIHQGCVLSEFPLGRPADRQSFPQRNRIVAGMVRAIVVIETDVDGGSMITARFAGELGKTLCAVPGRIDSPASRGCHALIRDGATLVSQPEDVLVELGELNTQTALPIKPTEPNPEYARWLNYFSGGTPHDAESLALASHCTTIEAATIITLLEIRGRLLRRPDGRHETI